MRKMFLLNITVFVVIASFCFLGHADSKPKREIIKQPKYEEGQKPNHADVEKAIHLTQDMLNDPTEREKQINKTPEGKAANQKVKDMAGSSANEQAIYELAAKVFGSMMESTGNDMEKMQKLMEEGLKNPEAFASKWSPEELQKLKDIAEESSLGVHAKPLKK